MPTVPVRAVGRELTPDVPPFWTETHALFGPLLAARTREELAEVLAAFGDLSDSERFGYVATLLYRLIEAQADTNTVLRSIDQRLARFGGSHRQRLEQLLGLVEDVRDGIERAGGGSDLEPEEEEGEEEGEGEDEAPLEHLLPPPGGFHPLPPPSIRAEPRARPSPRPRPPAAEGEPEAKKPRTRRKKVGEGSGGEAEITVEVEGRDVKATV